MKTLPFILALLVIFSCREGAPADHAAYVPRSGNDSTAQPSARLSTTSDQLKNVEDIKKEYNAIISKLESDHMDSTAISYNCRGEKSGKLVYFSDEKGLRLIKHTYDEYSHFSATDQYFVKDDSLFFVFYKHVAWSFDSQAQGESQTIDKVTEARFYIIKNKPLQCLEKKYTIRSTSSENMLPQQVANKTTDCPSLQAVLNKFRMLQGYRDQKENMDCLEE